MTEIRGFASDDKLSGLVRLIEILPPVREEMGLTRLAPVAGGQILVRGIFPPPPWSSAG